MAAGAFNIESYVDGAYYASNSFSGLQAGYYTEVSLTIPGGLNAGTHSIEFKVDSSYNVDESDEGNNIRTESFTWTGNADLIVSDISAPTSLIALQSTTVTALIRNIGNVAAGAYYIALYVDDAYEGSWPVNGLPTGGSAEFRMTIPGLEAGPHAIEFYADFYNHITESNEINNSRTESFIWTGDPDLIVSNIYAETSLVSGRDSVITTLIRNIGNADAGPFSVALNIDGLFDGSYYVSGGLAAGDITELSLTFHGGLEAGTHSIQFVADSNYNVAESNEGNNSLAQNFIWTGMPDLVLPYIYEPTSLIRGEDTTITALIANTGSADAGPFSAALFIDNNHVNSIQQSGLSIGQYTEVDFTITGGLSAGSHTIKITADYNNTVVELQESNNSATLTRVWSEPLKPLPPTGVSAVAEPGSGQVTVSWGLSSSPDVDYYKIFGGTSSGNYSTSYTVPKEWSSGTIISELTNNLTYYFAMKAMGNNGTESVFSNETSAKPIEEGDTVPPTTPVNVTVTNPGSGTALTVNWSASSDNTGVSHYELYRLTDNTSISAYNYDYGFPVSLSGTSYNNNGLSDNSTYCYAVLAVDEAGNESALSIAACKKPGDNVAPSAPTGIGIYGGTTLVIWWAAPTTNTDGTMLTDLAGYNIYRGTTSGQYGPSPINGTTPVASSYYSDTSVTQGTKYYYVVKAVDSSSNQSPASAEVSATAAQEALAPKAPTLSITAKETELDLYWTQGYETDLAGYKLYRRTATTGYAAVTPLQTNAWYSDSQGLLAGETYYYVVTAVDIAGHESAYSNEVSGVIAQGAIWIIFPTELNSATIDFGAQTAQMTTAGLTTNATTGGRVEISYKYNFWDRIIKVIYLQIVNSSTQAIVYESNTWSPGSSPDAFMWNGKGNDGKCVPDGQYTSKLYLKTLGLIKNGETEQVKNIEIKNCNLAPTVAITDVITPCESLNPPYRCVDSFIANRARNGDSIAMNAQARRGAVDVSNQIVWTCSDNPDDMIDSGICIPATGIGATLTFIPNPLLAPNGRPLPLSYRILARISVGETNIESSRVITQDTLDQLRQQYHDMGKNRRPERIDAINAQNYLDPGHFPYEDINSPGDITVWALFTIAQNLENVRTDIGNQAMPVNSGYRTPRHNATMIPHSPESQHIYGTAADISSNRDYNGDGVVGNRADWDFLRNAARNRGACVEPWDGVARVHMDWRGACPPGW